MELQVSAIEQGQTTAPLSNQAVHVVHSRRLGTSLVLAMGLTLGFARGAIHANVGGHGGSSATTAEHGECHDLGDPLHREPGKPHEPPAGGGGGGLVRDDWSEDVLTTMHHETSQVFRLVHEFTQELQQTMQDTKPLGTRWVLGEVMRSSNSPLTHHVQQCGKSAFRFRLAQGEWPTQSGRLGLFQTVARHRPRYIGYSPVCGLWSPWSQLNSSRSLEHQKEYQMKRHELLCQVGSTGNCAVPTSSFTRGPFSLGRTTTIIMLKLPSLSEIHEHTQACELTCVGEGTLQTPKGG